MIEDAFHPQPWFRLFPEPTEVFCIEQNYLAQHLHAVASIDLSAINPDWHGRLPIINPLEPYECYIGDQTTAHHNEFARENWLSFRLLDDNRLQFLGKREYFYLENEQIPEPYENYREDLQKHYAKQQRSHDNAIVRFQRYENLYSPKRFAEQERAVDATEPLVALDQVGGIVGWSNWTGCPDPPTAYVIDTTDDDNVFPVMSSTGDRFWFVAGVTGWRFRDSGADWIVTFYEPNSRTVLVTFDWT